ncbi:hypothetical protein CRYUN_Cryun20dG0054900 [Craigia yunnanensis]
MHGRAGRSLCMAMSRGGNVRRDMKVWVTGGRGAWRVHAEGRSKLACRWKLVFMAGRSSLLWRATLPLSSPKPTADLSPKLGDMVRYLRMAHTCVWTSASSLRLSSLLFSPNSNINLDSHELSLPFHPLRPRIIRCGGAVDDAMENIFVAQLLYLDAVDPQKVWPYLTLQGISGLMSRLCVLDLQLGKRYSLPNSRIMIYQPLGGAQGQTDIDIQLLYSTLTSRHHSQANEMLHHKANLNGSSALAPTADSNE